MSNVNTSMIIVGGSKGGVGKSLVCMAVVDWLHCAKKESVLLIDSDGSNPDVNKAYDASELKLKPLMVNLDLREGWLVLADRCAEHRDAHVVINTGAGNLDSMLRYSGPAMNAVATELQRPVTVLWVIDDMRDSVELLRRYFDDMHTGTQLHVVCNEGEEERRSFFYNETKTTATVLAEAGCKTIVVPTLAKRATTLLYTERKSIRVVAGDDPDKPMPFGTRVEMNRWRKVVWERLDRLGIA